MGFFDGGPYDLDGDEIETDMETFVGMQMFAGSRQEAIDLTGDDSFYCGDDDLEDNDSDDEDDGFRNEFDDSEDYDDADEYDDAGSDGDGDWD
jgi:hypothetical protein